MLRSNNPPAFRDLINKKKLAALALTSCLGLFSPAAIFSQGEAAAPAYPELKLQVSSVQLYSRQALVHRSGTAQLKQGMNVFTIADLSEHLIDESVKLSAGRSPGIKIQEIQLETRHEKIFRHEQAREAERFLREARGRLKKATDEYQALKDEEKFLRTIKIGKVDDDKELAKKHVDPGRWSETLDFVRDSLQRNHEQTIAVLDRIDLAREELNVALTVAGRFRSGKSIRKKDVLITIESDRARSAPLRLEYRIRKAGWFPIYSARVSTTETRGDLRLFAYALVRNETGEDWPRVRLNFSAADPEETAGLPQLSEWRIRAVLREQNRRRAGRSSGAVAAADVERSLDEDVAQEEARARPAAEAPAPAARPRPQGTLSKRKDDSRGFSQSSGPGGGLPSRPQLRLEKEKKESISFYSQNKKFVQERRAGKRATKMERDLRDLKASQTQQKRALEGGNYNEALNQSVRTLENLRGMSPRYREYFADDIRQAEEVRRKSLAMLETEKLVSQLVAPVTSSRGYDYRYQAALPETIPSDGAFHKVLLFEKKLPVELHYEAVPARKLLAFLVGRVSYADDTPLLTGPVSVFHNLDYVGQSRLSNVSSRRPFKLHLGSDEDLKVSRRRSEFRGSKGLISRDYELQRTVRITINNRKKFPVTLDLFDRIPYSEDELIQITDVNFSTEPDKKHDTGLLRFQLKLAPGQERKVEISYRLRHPKDALPTYNEKSSPRW